MGDGLKITKDKRHRSSSSLAGGNIEGTRSERKLDIRASIPEVDDQFALAEARCDDLKEKIDTVKGLKRRRKLKKRSMTRVSDQTVAGENIPFISVRTQPKKILMVTEVSPQAARLRRLELPANPTRGYLDPAMVEQHEMVGQVRGYNQMFRQPQRAQVSSARKSPKVRPMSRGHPEGDAVYEIDSSTDKCEPQEVACGDDEVIQDISDHNDSQHYYDNFPGNITVKKKKGEIKKGYGSRRRNKDPVINQIPWSYGQDYSQDAKVSPRNRRQASIQQSTVGTGVSKEEERPVVELFNKSRGSTSPESWQRHPFQKPVTPDYEKKRARGDGNDEAGRKSPDRRNLPEQQSEDNRTEDGKTENIEKKKKIVHRRVNYRGHHYEMPTVASQMKQAGMRCYYEQRCTSNIPFIVSKSTAPSHNIGVNIQQVLNGMKIQQPVSGIPFTMAHHMGLGYLASTAPRSTVLSLDNREMNAIRVGRRLVRLPSYKRMVMPYNRLLHMYSEGDGMVPRFLRAMSRPNYIYTSMYNLSRNRDDATSKGHSESHEAKQSLAIYAKLYREYERICKSLEEKNDADLDSRKQQLMRELTARAEQIGKVVDEQEKLMDPLLKASASNEGR
ncbi:uncharacterized protein LOC110996327 isoform X2 [Pieris rapae]|uniref:uncharacterized protein LOC110996327 isoform X2 n=1 Tax=Pieris rapae TaxID=64459 RepID=UPI001E27C4D8|nr:uncharacterized protein LOC110996327 isoform X2 [Pieris rapae]